LRRREKMPYRNVAPVFTTTARFAGADARTRRALTMAVVDIPAVQRIEAACKKLKVDYKVPYWKHDTWAHIGLPNLSVAIFMTTSLDEERTEEFRQKWAKHNWKLLGVGTKVIERTPVEELVEHLKIALRELGKRV
jgi:hypothetical protein